MRLVAGRRAEIYILYRERVCICWCGKKTCMLNVSQHYALELPASSSAYELLSLAKSNTIFSRGFFFVCLSFRWIAINNHIYKVSIYLVFLRCKCKSSFIMCVLFFCFGHIISLYMVYKVGNIVYLHFRSISKYLK